tara:strand:+ start:774 stop:1016 length:243 start_codon:yes stop_codon:yes gene_type:complete
MSKEILFFSSKACGPCRNVKQQLNESLTQELNIRFLDAEEDTNLFIEHKVMGVPTFIKLVNGVETNRKSGYRTIKEIKEL